MKKLLKLKENFLKSDLKDKYLDLLAFSNTGGDYGILELKKSSLEPVVKIYITFILKMMMYYLICLDL